MLALNVLEAGGSSDRANSRRNSLNEKIANHQQERLCVCHFYTSSLQQHSSRLLAFMFGKADHTNQ